MMNNQNLNMKKLLSFGIALSLFLSGSAFRFALGQSRPMTEDDYYRIVTLPVPENVSLEVGGLAPLPDGRLAACTRRGYPKVASTSGPSPTRCVQCARCPPRSTAS